MIRVRGSPATKRSRLSSTWSACRRSPATTHAVSSALCHLSWCAVSATETLKRSWSRSFRLFTTERFSFSDCAPKISSSQATTPTTTASPLPGHPAPKRRSALGLRGGGSLERAGELLHAVALDMVAHLQVVVPGDIQPALEAFPHLADVVREALQAGQLALVDLNAV